MASAARVGPERLVGEAVEAVRSRAPLDPRVALILGSGLGELAAAVEQPVVLPTTEIPGFPASTVTGHAGQVIVGRLAGQATAVLAGRTHLYEGYAPIEVVFGVRVLAALGCRTLIITNAAGALNKAFAPGDLMLIEDHVDLPALAGWGPLVGVPGRPEAPRFVDMTRAYDPGLLEQATASAAALGIPLRRGVYVQVAGPQYETPAEVRVLRALGGDVVGMSTAHEVIVARQLGLRVLGVSCITNAAADAAGPPLSHDEVTIAAGRAGPRLAGLIRRILEDLS